jgi:hypothetical protein
MKPPCTTKIPIDDINDMKPGTVIHDDDCAREWLILGKRITGKKAIHVTRKDPLEGVFPCLFFDTEMPHLSGKGAIALLFNPNDLMTHVAENGLRSGADE